MSDLPADWTALCALVFVLGLKHGLDADHLAAIDGMTRLNAAAGRRLASWCGALFSLGHGALVMTIAAVVGGAREHWQPPRWLDAAGAWVSIVFLLLLGVANLRAVLAAAPHECVAVAGIKGRLLGSWARARSPWAVAAVGALFALSFDTVSQAALFSVTAVQFGGLARALALGAVFVAGMVLTDGLNGWWIGHLARRAVTFAPRASRRMGLAVAGLSLGVGALGIARQLSTGVDHWAAEQALLLGTATVVLVTLTCTAQPAMWWLRRARLGVRREDRRAHGHRVSLSEPQASILGASTARKPWHLGPIRPAAASVLPQRPEHEGAAPVRKAKPRRRF